MSSLRERQRTSIIGLLCLNEPRFQDIYGTADKSNLVGRWRVLVYDKSCSAIISPLFNVRELRDLGITLHMLLGTTRERIQDVDAVYFLSPTERSISRLVSDISNNLYDKYYVNFSSSLSRRLLEKFAQNFAGKGCKAEVHIVEHMLDHVVLEERLFILNSVDSFLKLNCTELEGGIDMLLDKCVNSLFSVIKNFGSEPCIRCVRGGPSEVICERLYKKLNKKNMDEVSRKYVQASEIDGVKKSLVIVLDRELDISQVFHH